MTRLDDNVNLDPPSPTRKNVVAAGVVALAVVVGLLWVNGGVSGLLFGAVMAGAGLIVTGVAWWLSGSDGRGESGETDRVPAVETDVEESSKSEAGNLQAHADAYADQILREAQLEAERRVTEAATRPDYRRYLQSSTLDVNGYPKRIGLLTVSDILGGREEAPYVPRDFDGHLQSMLREGASGQSPSLIVVLGGVGTGKTRSTAEAIHSALPERTLLLAPDASNETIETISEWSKTELANSVVWLDGPLYGPWGLDMVRISAPFDRLIRKGAVVVISAQRLDVETLKKAKLRLQTLAIPVRLSTSEAKRALSAGATSDALADVSIQVATEEERTPLTDELVKVIRDAEFPIAVLPGVKNALLRADSTWILTLELKARRSDDLMPVVEAIRRYIETHRPERVLIVVPSATTTPVALRVNEAADLQLV